VGGLGALSYAFDVYNGTQKIVTGSFGSSTSYTYTPTAIGYYSVELRVKDTLGTEKALKTASVLVTAPLLAVRVSSGKSTAAINEQVSFTLETAEGVGGNSYQYYLIKGGRVYDSKTVAAGASNSVSFSAPEAGSYQVRAYAKDGNNTRVVAYATLTVA
jgi:PKD repeat protein